MRLILIDGPDQQRVNFYPLTLGRPVWELRCGFDSLGEKLIARWHGLQARENTAKMAVPQKDVACFVPDYMADSYRRKTKYPVNDSSGLQGDDLLILNPCIKAESFNVPVKGPSEVGLDEQGNVMYARIDRDDAGKLSTENIEGFIADAKAKLPNVQSKLPRWQYIWDLILNNAEQITADFAAAGQNGIEGTVEQPNAGQ